MNTLKEQLHKQLPHLSKADVHIHSNFSDGLPTVAEILEYVENHTDLAVIAITDHDTIDGSLLAKKLMKEKKYRFELVVGEEVSAKEGHILALFIKERIAPNQTAHETIKQIHAQGGVAVAAHPLYASRLNYRLPTPVNGVGVKELLNDKRGFDGIETVNATPLMGDENLRAKYLNRLLLFRTELGSSDAHILDAIGKGYTLFEGKSAAALKKAILEFQTQSMNDKWSFFGVAKYAFFFLPLGFRTAFHTIVFGPNRKNPEVIKFPNRFKIMRELAGEKDE
jgi:predicted metal-dependent phosphoesterase TrpH